MATKSFFKDNVIKSPKEAILFLDALEQAEKAKKKDIKFDKPVKTIKDKDTIRKMFG